MAELSRLPGRVQSLEEELASVQVSLAASEEGLTQATLRAEKADALAKVREAWRGGVYSCHAWP